jgi:predicted HTH domain antitoxin
MNIERIIQLIEDEAEVQNISKNKLAAGAGISRFQLQNILARRTIAPRVDTMQSLLQQVGYTLKVVRTNDI